MARKIVKINIGNPTLYTILINLTRLEIYNNYVNVRQSSLVIEPPSAPRSLTATEISSTSVLLKWTNPKHLGTGDGLAYAIRYRNSQHSTMGNVYKTTHTNFYLTGLNTFTYYTVTISAVNNITKAINRKYSESVSFKTLSGCK